MVTIHYSQEEEKENGGSDEFQVVNFTNKIYAKLSIVCLLRQFLVAIKHI